MTAPAPANRELQLEHIFSYWTTLAPPEVIGPTPDGLRLNVYHCGGEVTGPKLRGRFRPVGGDWLLVRSDGVGLLDVRGTMELEDGALVYTSFGGVADLGPDGYNLALKGEFPNRVEVRVVPRYHTSHLAYLWLNRLQCVGAGVADVEHLKISYDIYALR